MKISDVLWNAANKKLYHPKFDDSRTTNFSCDAVYEALSAKNLSDNDYYDLADNTMSFLEQLGLSTNSCQAFDEFKGGAQRQEARYAWLMFAAMVAEEEGL